MLNMAFPPFSEHHREKPRDMEYIAPDRPDLYTMFTLGATHTLSALMLVVYTVIIGTEIGLSDSELRGFVSLEIIVMGFATLLQNQTTRFSSGHLIVHSPSVVSMGAFITAATQFGLGAAAGGLIVAAITMILLARFLPRMQALFPPEVAGVLLVLLGLTLVEVGVKRFTALENGHVELSAVASAFTTLVVIVFISVWAGKRLRVFAVVGGTCAGLAVAVLTGDFGAREMAIVANQPLFAFPLNDYKPPMPTLVLGAAIPLILIQIIAALNGFGAGVAIDKLNDAKWRRADLPMISRLISGLGLSVMLNGFTGTAPIAPSSANLGLVALTGVAARRVGMVAALLLILAAFFPQISSFIIQIPLPVVGAIIVYTAGYMLVIGMELILSRMLNSRRTFMVGLSITVGASLMLMPELGSEVPPDLRPVLTSPLTMGGLFAIGLNLLFRIGISESASIELSGIHAASEATRFLEDHGADWGARKDVMTRAGGAVGEALEGLQGNDMLQGPVTLRASFDEFKLDLTLEYEGQAFSLERQKIDLAALLAGGDDAALDETMAKMSSHLVRNLADQVSSHEQAGFAKLHMQFNH